MAAKTRTYALPHKTKKAAAVPAPRPVTNTTGISPLGDYVLILPDEAASVSGGGILLPETGKDHPNRGKVLAVGPGLFEYGHFTPTTLQVGDHAIFEQFSGTSINVGGKEHKLIRQAQLMATQS